jgi:hypothetical protein
LNLKADFGCGDGISGLQVRETTGDQARGITGDSAPATLETRPAVRIEDTVFLEACAYGEEAMQNAYVQALNTHEDLPPAIFHLVEKQLWSLQNHYPTFIKDAGNIPDDGIDGGVE